MLEPLWRDYRRREELRKQAEDLLAAGLFELLPGMLRDERARRVLVEHANRRWRSWQRWAIIAGIIYGSFPVILTVIEVGRISGWWR